MSAGAEAELICPKCQGTMRSYERSGVVVDQCTECRGVFLDRGELEKLMDAESAAYSSASGGEREPEQSWAPGGGHHGGGTQGGSKHGGKRRGGFLGDLFD